MKPSKRVAAPPIEKDAVSIAERWRATRAFKKIVCLPMPLHERVKWMSLRDLSDFRIFSCGLYAKASGHSWKRSGLDEGVLIYCVEGKGSFRQGKRTWSILPGDVLYCFPRTRHSYLADPADPWTIYWMHISGPRVGVFERLLGFTSTNPVIHIGIRPEVIDLFNELLALHQAVYGERHLLGIQACGQHLLARIALSPRFPNASPIPARQIQATLNQMQGAIAKGFDLDLFARTYGTTKPHFCRMFRRLMGATPLEYFNRLRIRKACALLADPAVKVKEVAGKLGFNDPYYFSRLFKKITEISPRNYRQGIVH
jgi:AraC-like DNA-binding protein